MFTTWNRKKIFSLIAESIDFAGKIFFGVGKCLQCGLNCEESVAKNRIFDAKVGVKPIKKIQFRNLGIKKIFFTWLLTFSPIQDQ